MYRMGVVLCLLFFVACKSKSKNGDKDENQFNYESFSEKFRKPVLPYQLSDTALLSNKDTTSIRSSSFAAFLPDSIKRKVFGSGARIRYTALARISEPDAESYYILKAVSGSKKVALVFVFDKKNEPVGFFPFLVPDDDPATSQVSSIDKSFSITRAISKRMKNDVTAEGKDVYIYNEEAKNFTLIMTDPLDNSALAVINPIDTFARKSRYAGDYTNGKRNIVSIRDAKNPGQVNFFVHFEKGEDCTGELKGTALMTSAKSAVFRQGGDPCVMEFNFTSRTVTIREVEGCGSHRSVTCVFEGTFTKKIERPKTGSRKIKKK
jgi:hypothetical protein